MTVSPFERCRFHVTSHGETFLVDLLPHKGNGVCDCHHFRVRLKPRIDEDKALHEFSPGAKYRCPHIEAARSYFTDCVLNDILKTYPDWKDTEI